MGIARLGHWEIGLPTMEEAGRGGERASRPFPLLAVSKPRVLLEVDAVMAHHLLAYRREVEEGSGDAIGGSEDPSVGVDSGDGSEFAVGERQSGAEGVTEGFGGVWKRWVRSWRRLRKMPRRTLGMVKRRWGTSCQSAVAIQPLVERTRR